jgi:hypothetical protein
LVRRTGSTSPNCTWGPAPGVVRLRPEQWSGASDARRSTESVSSSRSSTSRLFHGEVDVLPRLYEHHLGRTRGTSDMACRAILRERRLASSTPERTSASIPPFVGGRHLDRRSASGSVGPQKAGRVTVASGRVPAPTALRHVLQSRPTRSIGLRAIYRATDYRLSTSPAGLTAK